MQLQLQADEKDEGVRTRRVALVGVERVYMMACLSVVWFLGANPVIRALFHFVTKE